MIRLDLSYFYRLGLTFDAIRRHDEKTETFDAWFSLFQAAQEVRNLFGQVVVKDSLRSTFGPATELLQRLDAITNQDTTDEEKFYTHIDRANLRSAINKFDTVLQSELAVSDAYFVVEKRPYSTINLIMRGESLFPPDTQAKVPGAIADLGEAGKCLAFELPTACGFHTMRAMEAVLRRYWEVVTNKSNHPKQRNIGVYLRLMTQQQCGDSKIIAALTQIKDLHRNAILHPQDTLTMDEAISLLGMARSVSAAMLAAIPDKSFELTPPPSVDYLPVPQ